MVPAHRATDLEADGRRGVERFHPLPGGRQQALKNCLGLAIRRPGRQRLRAGQHRVPVGRQGLPQFSRCGEALHLAFGPGDVVDLDDLAAIAGICELQPEDLSIVTGLLHTGLRRHAGLLGFNNGKRKITPEVQEVVSPLELAAPHTTTGDNDAAVGEAALLSDGMRRDRPASINEPGRDELAAGVCLGLDGLSLRCRVQRICRPGAGPCESQALRLRTTPLWPVQDAEPARYASRPSALCQSAPKSRSHRNALNSGPARRPARP